MLKRYFARGVNAQHNHTRHPWEQNVAACFHNAKRVHFGQLSPIQVVCGYERPLARAKPGVKRVFFALVCFAVYLNGWLVDTFIENPVIFVVDTLECRNRNAPRNLTAEVPVFKAFKVINEHFTLISRSECNVARFERRNSRLYKWSYF